MRILGEVTFRVVRADGSVVARTLKNLVVQWALDTVAGAIIGTPFPNPISYLALGDGSSPPALGNTTLGNELRRDLAVVTLLPGENNKIQFEVTHALGAVTGTFREAGLFDAAAGGNMFNHMAFADLVVGALDTLSTTWTITVRNM